MYVTPAPLLRVIAKIHCFYIGRVIRELHHQYTYRTVSALCLYHQQEPGAYVINQNRVFGQGPGTNRTVSTWCLYHQKKPSVYVIKTLFLLYFHHQWQVNPQTLNLLFINSFHQL